MRIDLVAFDLDGVLLDTNSSWVTVHKHFGTDNYAGLKDYLDGLIDDHEFMEWDINLWRGKETMLSIDRIRKVLDEIPIMEGAEDAVGLLHSNDIATAIISGGIDLVANRTAELLGIEIVMANGLETDAEGYLTGRGILNVPLLDKGPVLQDIISQNGISQDRVAVVGNSQFDCSMFLDKGLNIAFNPEDEIICEKADKVIREKDLRLILDHILGIEHGSDSKI